MVSTAGQRGWRVVLVLLLVWRVFDAQAACDPSVSCCAGGPASGSPCGGAGVATLGNDSGTDLGVGNPIHLISGNKFQREVDMAPLPGVLGLELIRYYNSADDSRGLLGRGWRLSYETTLQARAGSLQITQADGTRLIFGQTLLRPDTYRARAPLQGLVRALATPRGTEHLWTWADGRQLRFNRAGKLEHIRAPSGEFVSLRYDGRGWLVEVTDPAGRRLGLNLLDKQSGRSGERFRGVQSIDTPVGRYRYEYGGQLPAGSKASAGEIIANLIKVSPPAQRAAERQPADSQSPPPAPGSARLYHHEDPRFPTLLTGISAIGLGGDGQPSAQRLSTWAYDAQRRAVLSVKGERPESGAGREQVNLQWLPQQSGQPKTLLTNSLGQVTVYDSAILAGEPRLLQVRGAGCASCGPSNVRYGHDRLGRLTEETVLDIQGRPVRTTRTELDGFGRPVSVSTVAHDNGKARLPQWLMRYDYVRHTDDSLPPSPRPVRIATPSVIPGRQRVLHISYNAAQQPISLIEEGFSPVDGQGQPSPQGTPIRRSTTYGYATLNGRSVLVSVDGPLPNGRLNSPQDSDITRYEWDARADHLLRVIRPGQRLITVQREPDSGRIVELIGPHGVRVPLPAPAMVPPQANADLNGNEGLHGNEGLNAALRIEHDPWARPIAWRTAGGPGDDALLTAAWGPAGSVAEASVLSFATPHAQAQRWLDDFGRVVAIRNPGQGWQFAQYDEAGRVIETIDPRGARQRASWDLAHRLIRLERFAAGAGAGADGPKAEQVIERRYQSERLIEERISDRYGQRITRLAYDHRGELASETLHIEPAGPLRSALHEPIHLSLAYRRHEGDRLSRTLIDAQGTQLSVVQALVAGQVARLSTEGVLPAWLGGGRELVRHIDWQELGGLRYATAITHGDGSVDRFERVSPEAQKGSIRAVTGAAGGIRSSLAPPGQGHDAAGLPATLQSRLGIQNLSWNAAGQLEQSEREDGSRSRYIYDARGRRVIKLMTDPNGQARASLSLYEGSRLVAEADERGRMTHAYVHLGYRPVAQIPLQHSTVWQRFTAWLFGPEARHLHTARAGRVLSVSERGQTVWRDEAALPSGNDGAEVDVQAIHQPLRYVGQYHDDESGLSYHGARFFEPIEGRFISPDPAGIADAVNDVPAGLLLDLYAYAGGRPDEYFDPDGAAKLTYYLIDTQPDGYSASRVTARWAFWLRDMGGAHALTQVLYDPRGSFLGSSANPLGASSQAYAQWTSSEPKGKSTVQAFVGHYVNDMLSPDSFTLEIDDAAALQLLEDLQSFGDITRKYYAAACSEGNAPAAIEYQLVLPPVKLRDFALSPGGIAGLNDGPGGQRIDQGVDSLTCQQAMTPERAFQRLKRAVEIKESGGMNCANTGCPSQAQNPAGTPASYGSTQFVVSTFVDRMLTFSDARKPSKNLNLAYRTLFDTQSNLSEEEKKALGFVDAQGQDTGLRQRLEQARSRFVYVLGGYLGNKRIVGWNARLTVDTPIDPASDSQVQQFAKETGFSHTPGSTGSEAYGMYVKMVEWAQMFDLMDGFRKDGRGNADAAYALLHQEALSQRQRGESPTVEQQLDALLADLGMTRGGFRVYLRQKNWNEGWQGFASAAVFTDKTLKGVLVDKPDALFKSRQKFDLISDREIRWKYAEYRIKYPDETEEDIVARIGYFHNAGSNAKTLSGARGFEYVRGLVGIWKDTAKMPCATMDTSRLALDPTKPKQ